MTFLYPAFLYALALTAIPVIIHIFNFRRFKKQEFTQVKFLEKATKVRKRFRQLKDLIIMLLRMLAIACLVIAFAHPLPKNAADTKGKQNLISIYIDNSFSMGLQGENGELLAVAKKKIEEITEAFGENTLYQLVNNNTAERSRTFVEKDILLDAVQQVDLKPFILTDNELNQLQRSDLMQGVGNRIQVVVSDFQKQSFVFENVPDSTITKYWIPIRAENESNISLDSAWFEQALFVKDQTARLNVLISNKSLNDQEGRSLVVSVNGVQKAIQAFDLKPNETKQVELFYKIAQQGWNEVKIEIEDYPIEFDNVIYTTYYVDPLNKVLSLYANKANVYVKRVFTNDDNFEFKQLSISNIGAEELSIYDLIIIESFADIASGTYDQLLNYAANGGNLALFMSKSAEQASLSQQLNKIGIAVGPFATDKLDVKSLQLNHPLFADIFEDVPKNIDYPKVSGYYRSSLKTRSSTEPLIQLSNGNAFLYHSEYFMGRVFSIMAPIDIEYSNFVKNGIFLPLLYKFATYKGNQSSSCFYIDQKPTTIAISGGSKSSVLELFNNGVSFIPNQVYKNGILTIFEDQMSASGFYEVKNQSKTDTVLYKLGINYDRNESDMTFWTNSELSEIAKTYNVNLIENDAINLTATFSDITDNNRIWRYFLIAALCFLLFEIIAIKLFFK